METEKISSEDGPMPDRWTLIRDILVLQLKLLVDGLRDLILVPISLVVGIASLLKGGESSGSQFYELLRTGRRTERWINLFGAADRVYGPSIADDRFPAEDIDEMVSRVESFVVDEYSKGGVTRQLKSQLDRALDSLHKLASSKGRGSDDKE
ncbi:MAG: hypothetical protein IH912_06825 [Proteobacteria bacterium]|nr:hypothetical protein [Pseudomonadota bacterium]